MILTFSHFNHGFVGMLFISAFFVTRAKDDGFAQGIEHKESSYRSAVALNSELFHVGDFRTVQRIDMRPPEVWTFLLQKIQCGNNVQLQLR